MSMFVWNNADVVSACLYYIGRALRRDPGYVKGLVFLRQILTEQPSLLKNTASYFKDWYVVFLFYFTCIYQVWGQVHVICLSSSTSKLIRYKNSLALVRMKQFLVKLR